MATFDEYCPIAEGVEAVGDRWTPLVLRELIIGSTRFNDIHRGVPRMSRTLLAQRLRDLQRNGLVERRDDGYHLTPAGAELEPVIWALGEWATRWRFGDPSVDQLDGQNLVWRMHQFVDPDRAPGRRTAVELRLSGPGGGRFWLVLEDGSATVCKDDLGLEVDLVVHGDNEAMHRWFLGRATWRNVVDAGLVRVEGPATLARSFPRWFLGSPFSGAVASAR